MGSGHESDGVYTTRKGVVPMPQKDLSRHDINVGDSVVVSIKGASDRGTPPRIVATAVRTDDESVDGVSLSPLQREALRIESTEDVSLVINKCNPSAAHSVTVELPGGLIEEHTPSTESARSSNADAGGAGQESSQGSQSRASGQDDLRPSRGQESLSATEPSSSRSSGESSSTRAELTEGAEGSTGSSGLSAVASSSSLVEQANKLTNRFGGTDTDQSATSATAKTIGDGTTVEQRVKQVLCGHLLTTGQPMRLDEASDEFSAVIGTVAEVSPTGPVKVTDATDVTVTTGDRSAVSLSADTDSDGGKPLDLPGLDHAAEKLMSAVKPYAGESNPFDTIGISPPAGILLHGPPGTGKTMLAEAVAAESDLNFHRLDAPEIIDGKAGSAVRRLRETFEDAYTDDGTSLVFIDEIDALGQQREQGNNSNDNQLVGQLLTAMNKASKTGRVVVVAATNRPDSLDTALRRSGRFDREIEIGVPSEEERVEILKYHLNSVWIANEVDPEKIANDMSGYTGADIETVVRSAVLHAIEGENSGPIGADHGETQLPVITDSGLEAAVEEVSPSATQRHSVETPDVTWDDVGGLDGVKQEMREAVEWPLTHPEICEQTGFDGVGGILLHGPPGTGKTLLAKAVAGTTDANFLSIAGPEIMDKYVGEAEKKIRKLYETARQHSPTIVFIDEIDAFATSRGDKSETAAADRALNQLLTELDGIESMDGVVTIAATNRHGDLDDAILRSGRFDREIRVGRPGYDERREIIEIHTDNCPLDAETKDEILDHVAAETEGWTPADLEALAQEASAAATRRYLTGTRDGDVEDIRLQNTDFSEAIGRVGEDDTGSDPAPRVGFN